MIDRKNFATLLLVGMTTVALYASYLLFRPYATPILFACVIAIVFYPLHRQVVRLTVHRNASAALSTVLTLLLSAVPLALLLIAVSNELANLYHTLAARNGHSGTVVASLLSALERVVTWARSHIPLPQVDVQQVLLHRLEGLSTSLFTLGATLVSNAFSFMVDAVIAVVILFFLFRDGESAVAKMMVSLPFPQERLAELRARISSTVVANFYGGVAIGALQGTLTGIAFWALGLDSPVLWGVVAGLFSLLPMLGTALVWVPAAIVLAFTGHLAKGVILLAFGAAVIGTVDNFVRPLILRDRVRLHTVIVFFALLGGLQLFGILGLFVGPVIVSVAAALLTMLKEDLESRHEAGATKESAMTMP